MSSTIIAIHEGSLMFDVNATHCPTHLEWNNHSRYVSRYVIRINKMSIICCLRGMPW